MTYHKCGIAGAGLLEAFLPRDPYHIQRWRPGSFLTLTLILPPCLARASSAEVAYPAKEVGSGFARKRVYTPDRSRLS